MNKAIVSSLASEDINYLCSKNVFLLPTPEVCDGLIRVYFHHVHPFFPIIEAQSFLSNYESAGGEKLSIQLLWSMFLAASNVGMAHHLPAQVIRS